MLQFKSIVGKLITGFVFVLFVTQFILIPVYLVLGLWTFTKILQGVF